jgi:hypothetical protein
VLKGTRINSLSVKKGASVRGGKFVSKVPRLPIVAALAGMKFLNNKSDLKWVSKLPKRFN